MGDNNDFASRVRRCGNILYDTKIAVHYGLHTVPDDCMIRIRELEAEVAWWKRYSNENIDHYNALDAAIEQVLEVCNDNICSPLKRDILNILDGLEPTDE